jgi:hypothetical protein
MTRHQLTTSQVRVQKHLSRSIRLHKLYYAMFYIPGFPQHTFPAFYERLCKLQQSLSQKPNEHARFFALMHEIFIFYHGCRSIEQDNNDWPGSVSYNGDVVEMWFPHSIGTPTVKLSILRLSLLKNGKDEFYCCIRVSCLTLFALSFSDDQR